jgi:uncharacterized membrane protein YczE
VDGPSQWRAGPVRLLLLLIGLWTFGTGDACVVAAGLGNSPWTVFAQGVARHSPLGIGTATIVLSVLVLCAWIPLAQRPGLGTVANAVVVGLAIGVMLGPLPDHPGTAESWLLLAGGIGLVAIGGGIYLAARLGPGPRDGLMTGISARAGRSLRLVRTCIELTALGAGAALGGTVGIGTVAFALGVGPGVQAALGVVGPRMLRLR